ncbi:hypothetical protein [Sphingomonas sp. IW22]|uniref:hypothetical protein n=1 Tax=Sphingomonas sp. IW22 TaxID=3242489 RepID=UPI0035227F63
MALSNDKKILILIHYESILTKIGKVQPQYETIESLCDEFNVNKDYAHDLRKKFFETGTLDRKSGSGRKHVEGYVDRRQRVVESIRKRRSSSIMCISEETDIPHTSVQRIIKEEGMRLISRRTCPLLSDDQKLKRLKWCRQNRHNQWDGHVDIDEKWFDLFPFHKERYHDGSPRRKQPLLSKGNPPKIMILTAIAKPDLEKGFNGLIGIWRIQKNVEAQRSSKNHCKGDSYKIDCTLTADYFYDLMTTGVMPMICKKMQSFQNVTVQMDNARPHIGKNNVELFNDFGDSLFPCITTINQPAQSPDLNANDIGFFTSLNKRVLRNKCTNVDKLWFALEENFWSTKPATLTSIFKSKSRIVTEIIKQKGLNVNVPHSL